MRRAPHCQPDGWRGKDWQPKQAWSTDDNGWMQWGESGLVLKKGSLGKVLEADDPLHELHDEIVDEGTYTTAFFEVFPENPNTFIRGEGVDLDAAEKQAYDNLQKYLACSEHEFERRDYENGAGFCKHCGLFKSEAFDPLTKCVICDTPTYYFFSKTNKPYCEEHKDDCPDDDIPEFIKQMRQARETHEQRRKTRDAEATSE